MLSKNENELLNYLRFSFDFILNIVIFILWGKGEKEKLIFYIIIDFCLVLYIGEFFLVGYYSIFRNVCICFYGLELF